MVLGRLSDKGDLLLSERWPSVTLTSARGHTGKIPALMEEQTS